MVVNCFGKRLAGKGASAGSVICFTLSIALLSPAHAATVFQSAYFEEHALLGNVAAGVERVRSGLELLDTRSGSADPLVPYRRGRRRTSGSDGSRGWSLSARDEQRQRA